MKIGRVTKHWNKNCLPWDYRRDSSSPRGHALLFIQQTAARFVEFLEQGDLSSRRMSASTRA